MCAAESYLGTKAKNAVITVPAYFNDSQRQVHTKLSRYIFTLVRVRMLTVLLMSTQKVDT